MSAAQKRLIAVKLVHTLIWAIFVSLITIVVYSGVTGHITPYSWLAVAAIIGEGAVLLVFKGRCPLTVVARKYSDSPKDNFDIYLPNWLAKYNKIIFTTVFCIGLLLMMFRTFY